MRKYTLLVLTDHANHSAENSIYPLVKAIRTHPRCEQVDVATRANPLNDFFFKVHSSKNLFVSKADESFGFYEDGRPFKKNVRKESLRNYDAIWLRMPPPLSENLLKFLIKELPNQLIINEPKAVFETGSKEFLMNFPDLCPPMKVCRSIEDIIQFKNQFPIVLKPFRGYGGKGLVRIDGDRVWEGNSETTLDDFTSKIQNTAIEYLGVKFLENVTQGDKKIVVINGHIIGSSLRQPPKDSWLCNIPNEGNINFAKVDEEEIEIVDALNEQLLEMGIFMYGIDTLVGDDGNRVLLEINTTNIDGLGQIVKLMGKPSIKKAAELLWNYIIEKS
ncbi:glutathione synthetase [Saprospiraceae bacterium]|jgi:glutathione synthase|nr:glutathione synthetase [Bacteroidota bacterium]MDB4727212.1 glutathione synthetase [Saprospiraceae bacterium]MDF1867455.1 glutathione synthetase [Saprospiraceae bacterium]